MSSKAEAVKDGQGDPSCSLHGMMLDPDGDGTWVCANPKCRATVACDSEDPDQ